MPEHSVSETPANVRELKVCPLYFYALDSGAKTFEFRRDDREPRFRGGDTLRLREFDGGRFGLGTYSGRECLRRVSYIARGGVIPDGFCVMSIERLPARSSSPETPTATLNEEGHDESCTCAPCVLNHCCGDLSKCGYQCPKEGYRPAFLSGLSAVPSSPVGSEKTTATAETPTAFGEDEVRAKVYRDIAAWHEQQIAEMRQKIRKAEDWSAEHNDGWREGAGTLFTDDMPRFITAHGKSARHLRRLAAKAERRSTTHRERVP